MKKLILLLSIFLVYIFIVNANECEEAGYNCRDVGGCNPGEERVYDLNCPYPEGTRPQICCKELITDIEPSMVIEPEAISEGYTAITSVELPYFANCDFYYINPDGIEKKEGGGGCGPSGWALNIGTYRLKELFGSLESGTWKLKIIAKKEGYDDITLIEEFKIGITETIIKKDCTIKEGEGNCIFFDKTYTIKHKGCNDNVNLEISYDNSTENFNNLIEGESEFVLKDEAKIKLTGAPCGVYQVNLLFEKEIIIECGNNICEVGEDFISCPEDCEEVTELPEQEPREISLQCSTGCLYQTYCVATGVRKGDEYCDENGNFKEQKTEESSCSNNYECKTNICIDGRCITSNLWNKFLFWFKKIFG